MDMVGECYMRNAIQLVKSGRVPLSAIDAACRRILEAKYDLGLFNDPYRFVTEERAKAEIMSADKLHLAYEAAVKSMVLLKNSGGLLPLKSDKKIAFIGPLVKDKRNLIGSWSAAGKGSECTSLWDALESKFGAHHFLYAKGCNLVDDEDLRTKLNRHDGQIEVDKKSPQELIDEAVKSAQEADVVVAVLGEAFGMTGEAASCSSIDLLDNQQKLLRALKATGKPIALVLMNGRPLTLTWEDANIDAILETWFAGTTAGRAITDVLFGDANPQGKLSMSFPRNEGQIPVHYNQKNTGRPVEASDPDQKYKSQYLDVPNEPLYPFGFGLSYTTFSYSDVTLNKTAFTENESLKAQVTVTNTGKYDGVEVVQLYVRDLSGSITRPLKELKSFQRVELKAGESKVVAFELTKNDLKFYGSDLKLRAEPGDFMLFIGGSSANTKEAAFKLLPTSSGTHCRKPSRWMIDRYSKTPGLV